MKIRSEIFGPPLNGQDVEDINALKTLNETRPTIEAIEVKEIDVDSPSSYINSKQAKADGFFVPGNCRITVGKTIFCPGPTLTQTIDPFAQEVAQRAKNSERTIGR